MIGEVGEIVELEDFGREVGLSTKDQSEKSRQK